MEEKQRAVIEYRETPFTGKARVVRAHIKEPVTTPEEAHKQFWASPVWSSETRKIEILETIWLD